MNRKVFEPVRPPQMILSPKLLDEFVDSLYQGVLMVRSVELPAQGVPLKADVTVHCDRGGNKLKVTGTLEIEHFGIMERNGDFLLYDLNEVDEPAPEEAAGVESSDLFQQWKPIIDASIELHAAEAERTKEYEDAVDSGEVAPMTSQRVRDRVAKAKEAWEKAVAALPKEEKNKQDGTVEKLKEDVAAKAALLENTNHPEWWSLEVVVDTNHDVRTGDTILLKLPPFDTFAFDRVAEALKSIGKEMKDYEDGYCRITPWQYRETVFPMLHRWGLRLPPPKQ